jgi:hypothetical protein
VRPVTLIAAICPLAYAVSTALDGLAPSLPLITVGLLALAATYRHPPFLLALAGAVVALFAGFSEAGVFNAAVLPAAGPAGLTRAAVAIALGVGTAVAVEGVLRLRAALPAPAVYRSSHD